MNPREDQNFNSSVADAVAEKVINSLSRKGPVRILRNSHLFSAMVGTAGLALFLVGIEKLFANFSGWLSVLFGLILLTISGALFKKLS